MHQKAGHDQVVELHGNSFHVACLNCKNTISRAKYQEQLTNANPSWNLHVKNQLKGIGTVPHRPDGDIELSLEFSKFIVPSCEKCGGIMKPTVVFFGENVPVSVVTECYDQVSKASKVLVIGSSLMVYSSFRFVKAAAERNIPIAAINDGSTRADSLFSFKIQARSSDALQAVLPHLHLPTSSL